MTSIDDKNVDRMLRDWRSGLECDDIRRERMLGSFLQTLSEAGSTDELPETKPMDSLSRKGEVSWARFGTIVALCASLLVAAFGWQIFEESSVGPEVTSPAPPNLASLSFSPEELRQNSMLTCELDRVFENQVQWVHRVNQTLDLDLTEPIDDREGTARLIVRFVVQSRVQGSSWETVQIEELIGGGDHQFTLSDALGVQIHYWSHLLPDESLWTEATISRNAESDVQCVARCRANQPEILWTSQGVDRQWQVVLVYELLEPCDGGLI